MGTGPRVEAHLTLQQAGATARRLRTAFLSTRASAIRCHGGKKAGVSMDETAALTASAGAGTGAFSAALDKLAGMDGASEAVKGMAKVGGKLAKVAKANADITGGAFKQD